MLHHHKFVLCVRECVCVRKAAELHLEEERKSLRVKYRPVDDLLSSDQFTSQRTVARAAKTIITRRMRTRDTSFCANSLHNAGWQGLGRTPHLNGG